MTIQRCGFPDCEHYQEHPNGMCALHQNVTVSTSWVDDRHPEGGHG